MTRKRTFTPGDVIWWNGSPDCGELWAIVGSHELHGGGIKLPLEAWKFAEQSNWVVHKHGHVGEDDLSDVRKVRQQDVIDRVHAEFVAAKLLGNVSYQGFDE